MHVHGAPARNIELMVNKAIVDELRKSWGGRLPTWHEFKDANESGQVATNKGIASRAIRLSSVPKQYYILYGIITPWTTFLIPATSIICYLVGRANGWIVLGSMLVGRYLYNVTLTRSRNGIREGAAANEALYQALVSKGAFLFKPKTGAG